MIENKVILSLRNISKQYPGVKALDDVSIDFREGEIHCIIGENGAGKSTFIKMISGADQPDMGVIEYMGRVYNAMTPHLSKELGIEVVYQEFNLAEDLTVAENMYLGEKPENQRLFHFKSIKEKSQKIFDDIQVRIDCGERIKNLSVSYMQFVEIGRAISKDLKVLILDEPTAPLTEDEVDKLLDLVLELKKKNYAVIYISHRLNELFKIGDVVTVLRDGKKIITDRIINMDTNTLIRHMVGRELSFEYPQRMHELGEVEFEVKNIYADKIRNISFRVRRGEVLGIGGLVGAGRTELLRAIYGADIRHSGRIFLEGKEVTVNSPKDAVKLGIGFLTEDRKRQGLLLEDSISWNISLPILRKISNKSVVNRKSERNIAERQLQELKIKTKSIETKVNFLSGGNQQKVVIAKWLAADCRVLFLDEPTRGVDVGAKQEIYKLIDQLAASGIGIILVSSEMEELLGISERVIVLHEGEFTGEVSKQNFSQELILKLASGIEKE